MVQSQENIIYGFTGEVGRDGILSPDQQLVLDRKQHEAAQTILGRLNQRQEGELFPAAVMATGIGKTRVEHEVIESWRRKNPQAKILFIAGTKVTLVGQTRAALTAYQQSINGGGNDYIESEDLEKDRQETEDVEDVLQIEQEDLPFYRVGRFKDKDADVRIATIQTVQSAYKGGQLDPSEFDLVIVDEMHNIGTSDRVRTVKLFKDVAGFTATPYRHSGNLKQPEQYGFEIAYNFPLPEAQNLRLLPPLLGMQINTADLIEEIPTTRSGQIDYKKLERVLKNNPELRPFIADKVAQIIKDGDKEYKTVIAVNFVWEAVELARLLKDKGVKVGVAVNKQATQQIHTDEIPAIGSIERYKLPRENPDALQVLISPYVASEGFDAPFTEVLVWASPTDSDLRYTQYVGRLARRANGKLFGLNLDFLYQTSQYGWSYNMGMWMKGDVKQLPSGLLYLGPEQDIAGLSELDVVKAMRGKADIMNLSDIQVTSLEDLKDTDLSLAQTGLDSLFRGGAAKLKPLAQQVKAELESEHPDYFAKRRNFPQIVDIVTPEGRQAFMDAMVVAGAELKDLNLEDIKETDLSLTQKGLDLFRGAWKIVSPVAQKIKISLEAEHPEYFAKRINGSEHIDVVTVEGREAFMQAMSTAGISLQDRSREEVKETDLPLTYVGLRSVFRGDWYKLSLLTQQVKAQLEIDHPEYFATRKRGMQYGTEVVTEEGRKAFLNNMVVIGAELVNINLLGIKESDLSLSAQALIYTFIGEARRLSPIAKKVKAQLKIDHPEYFAMRKSGTHFQEVLIEEGRQVFIQAMIEAGVKLRDK